MSPGAPPVCLAGTPLGDARHVCAFFGSDDEEYRVLLPFIKDGFDCGDRTIHSCTRTSGTTTCGGWPRRDRHGGRRGARPAPTAHQHRHYLRDGRFDAERMLAVFERLAGGDGRAGSPPPHRLPHGLGRREPRGVGRGDRVRVAHQPRLVPARDAVVCSYRLVQLSGDALLDIMKTHPMVIVGGTLQQNPFFVPPEQFLPESGSGGPRAAHPPEPV